LLKLSSAQQDWKRKCCFLFDTKAAIEEKNNNPEKPIKKSN